ncbi:MAG: TlpA disulfide reductase family protein, partial [Flavitalea sp.]
MLIVLVILLLTRAIAQDENLLVLSMPSNAGEKYRLVTNQALENQWQGEVVASGSFNEKGSAKINFNLNQAGPILLFTGQVFYRIWVQPGKQTEFVVSKAGFAFKGAMARENEFLFKSGLMTPFNPSRDFNAGFQPAEFTRYYDSITTARRVLFNLMFDLNASDPYQIPDAFRNYCSGEIEGFNCFSKSQYPMRFIYGDKSLTYQSVPAGYYDFWKKFELLPDDNGSDMYHNALRDYIAYLALKKNNMNASEYEALAASEMVLMDSVLKDHPKTLAKQKAIKIDFVIKYFDYPGLTRAAVEAYLRDYPGTRLSDFVAEKWNAKNKNLKSKPLFRLKDLTGNIVHVSDFKGKLVYIDFWGSWCKACISQMPNSVKLQEHLKDKPVVFLFIDFYDDADKWKKAVKQYSIKGTHVKADKIDEAYFDEHFGVSQGFPRYALIGKDGVLITTAAPHPGEAKEF